jgi:hypothetical protein
LDAAFSSLNGIGIIALGNAGYEMSDGLSDVGEALHKKGGAAVKGYCFYHGQDVERAVDGLGLYIAFGDLNNDKVTKIEIGHIVKQMLESKGFVVDWNGQSETRLKIPQFDWKRRSG